MSEEEWFVSAEEEEDLDDFKRAKIEIAAEDDEDDDNNLPAATAATTAVAAAAAAGQLVPYEIVPLHDYSAVRPDYAVVDNVSYYNHVSMWTLMYAKTTCGFPIPPVLNMGGAAPGARAAKFDF